MRTVDRLTTERYGIPSILLMENAAHAVARVITDKLGGSVKGKSILILCGPGNNGGDGAALARMLSDAGAVVTVEIFGKVIETDGDARVNFEKLEEKTKLSFEPRLKLSEVQPETKNDGVSGWMDNSDYDVVDMIVDALFGTGLNRKLNGFFDEQIGILNDWKKLYGKPLFVSIDLPSGLNADIPAFEGKSIHADVTVTFTSPKPANVLPPASRSNGQLIVADIGSPQELIDEQSSQLYLTEIVDAEIWLKMTEFSSGDYKNKRGHTLVIAGSENYSGAVVLCGNAAMRSGVGLVTVATPLSSKDSVASRILPEVMVRGVAETKSGSISVAAFDELADLLGKADSVAIGCGISQDASTKKFVEKVIEHRRQPVIVDADALNLLSPFTVSLLEKPPKGGTPNLILTPHEGEFMRLLGTDHKNALKDRVTAVRNFAVTNNVILVLKGERVLIGSPDGRVVVNPTGNSGLGKAGNGDTLAGILAGFVAQAVQFEIDVFETVVAAVYVAGMAGDIAERKYGKRAMTASDVRECLTETFANLAGN